MILVTGASGLVGSAFVKHLSKKGVAVRACVRRRSADFGPSVDTVPGVDLSETVDFSPMLRNVSVVVHAAARVHVMHETSVDPLADFRRVNVEPTVRLAKQAAAAGVTRFIFISTAKVNGECTELSRPFLTTDQPHPQDPYAVSKLEAELGLQAIAAETGLELVIVRPPLIYGPGVKANFKKLMCLIAKRMPLPLSRVESNRRSLVGIDNLIDFLSLCVTHPKAVNQIFFVSDGCDISTVVLFQSIARALGRSSFLFPVPVPWLLKGAEILGFKDVALRLLGSLQLDISKNKNLLGWVPPFSLDDGLCRVAAEFKTKQTI